ncbi:hypothetical protein A6B39_04400 [Mannheimia granulomatis]|uniref:site-specific DNA-methyltransferase n=1 Tax=Mannheimia granulomatis TaxID=85402 RepID=UPI00159D8B76|nr:site-specific DNA-methyltransferase [Mannheimia granulomatis]QLB14746.1 hypothetical protein A6B39_04400 [Mannheimia granulomatis]
MNHSQLYTQLEKALQPYSKLWANEEKTVLAKNILIDGLEKTDPEIIRLLLKDSSIKSHFFADVEGVLVFRMQDFRLFLDKHNFINQSYTRYANRIGLTDGKRFLNESSDVVLDFPFKDCVLNGGQRSEEGEEIYFEHNKDAQLSSAQLSSAQLSSIVHKENY